MTINLKIDLSSWELIPFRVHTWGNGTLRSKYNPCYKFLCFTLSIDNH